MLLYIVKLLSFIVCNKLHNSHATNIITCTPIFEIYNINLYYQHHHHYDYIICTISFRWCKYHSYFYAINVALILNPNCHTNCSPIPLPNSSHTTPEHLLNHVSLSSYCYITHDILFPLCS